jgi:Zn finger protein HypA/HybF involved in hydrogenase expression
MVARTDVRIKHQLKFAELMDLPWDEFETVGHGDNLYVRRRLLIEQEGRCNKCENYEWFGEPIALELEHKNGTHHDNDRDNIELLCPNCHAMTPTWRGRNKNNKIVSDDVLLEALRRESSIRRALISVGLAGKGGNYRRCHELKLQLGP